jgi:hypothetical protein
MGGKPDAIRASLNPAIKEEALIGGAMSAG